MWEILKVRKLSESCESRPQEQKEQNLELVATAKIESRKHYNDTLIKDMEQLEFLGLPRTDLKTAKKYA